MSSDERPEVATKPSVVLYARIPRKVYDALKAYADEKGHTLSRATADLLTASLVSEQLPATSTTWRPPPMSHSSAYAKLELQNRRDAGVALEKLAAAAAAAERALAVWGDSVRAFVEEREGIGPEDPRAWDDQRYASTLDLYAHVRGTHARVIPELEVFQKLTSGEEEPVESAILAHLTGGALDVP